MANNIDDAHPDLTEENLQNLLNSSAVPLTDKVPLESLSNLFKVPDSPQFTYSSSYGETFERFKVKVDLLKWLIGTVGLTLITFIINWGFRDREQGMNEISQYDKYATELIVLNDNPVKKRMLAQFFANVTPSEKLKCGWEKYFSEVDAEYKIFMKEAELRKQKLDSLNKLDTLQLSKQQKEIIRETQEKVQDDEYKINGPLIVPEITSNLQGNIKTVVTTNFTKSNIKDRVLADEYQNKGFSSMLNKEVDNAIQFFTQSENSYNGYNCVYEIAKYLKENRAILINNPENWNSIYKTILTDKKYNYKLPENIKKELEAKVK